MRHNEKVSGLIYVQSVTERGREGERDLILRGVWLWDRETNTTVWGKRQGEMGANWGTICHRYTVTMVTWTVIHNYNR